MRIEPDTKCWIVTDPGPHPELGPVRVEATFGWLGLEFRGWLDAEQSPAIFTTMKEAREEARTRLRVWRSARQARIEEGLPAGAVVTVLLHDADGRVVFDGEVGEHPPPPQP